MDPGNCSEMGLQTFFIVPPQRRKKTLLFNTLHVRNAMMPSGKRKPSFKMVSNMVMQLLHSIKYSVEVPFSNIAQQPSDIQKMNSTKKVKRILCKADAIIVSCDFGRQVALLIVYLRLQRRYSGCFEN